MLHRFQNNIAIRRGVAGADEADGVGDEFFEIVVRESGDFDLGVESFETVEAGFIFLDDFGWVGGEEFLSLPDLADFKIIVKQIEEIRNRGNAAAKGEVYGFDFVPVRKCPVSDDDGVGVTDASEEVENVGIEDSFLEHGFGWLLGRS